MDNDEPIVASDFRRRQKAVRPGVRVSTVSLMIEEATAPLSSSPIDEIDPYVEILSSTSTAAWATYDFSKILPKGAKFAILEISGSSDTTDNARVNGRSSEKGQSKLLHRARAGGGGGDDVGSVTHPWLRLAPDMTAQLEVVDDYSYDLTIRVTGYVM